MWFAVRKDVEQLARMLASYADLLLSKRARMEEVHSLTEVVRQIGDNISVFFIKHRIFPPAFLFSISEAVKELDSDTPLELWIFLSADQQRRYEWVQVLRMGLDVPLIHVTYTSGSNIGNLHWI